MRAQLVLSYHLILVLPISHTVTHPSRIYFVSLISFIELSLCGCFNAKFVNIWWVSSLSLIQSFSHGCILVQILAYIDNCNWALLQTFCPSLVSSFFFLLFWYQFLFVICLFCLSITTLLRTVCPCCVKCRFHKINISLWHIAAFFSFILSVFCLSDCNFVCSSLSSFSITSLLCSVCPYFLKSKISPLFGKYGSYLGNAALKGVCEVFLQQIPTQTLTCKH